jgi:hypothetical protein
MYIVTHDAELGDGDGSDLPRLPSVWCIPIWLLSKDFLSIQSLYSVESAQPVNLLIEVWSVLLRVPRMIMAHCFPSQGRHAVSVRYPFNIFRHTIDGVRLEYRLDAACWDGIVIGRVPQHFAPPQSTDKSEQQTSSLPVAGVIGLPHLAAHTRI